MAFFGIEVQPMLIPFCSRHGSVVSDSTISQWTNGVLRSEADEEVGTDVVGMNETPGRKLLADDGDSVGGFLGRLIGGIDDLDNGIAVWRDDVWLARLGGPIEGMSGMGVHDSDGGNVEIRFCL